MKNPIAALLGSCAALQAADPFFSPESKTDVTLFAMLR
jgi:hypothetical protein